MTVADGVKERDRADDCFDRAREALRPGPQRSAADLEPGEAILMAVEAVVNALEGVMRQIRDLDDDVWHLKSEVGSSFGDLAIVLNGMGGDTSEKKRGR